MLWGGICVGLGVVLAPIAGGGLWFGMMRDIDNSPTQPSPEELASGMSTVLSFFLIAVLAVVAGCVLFVVGLAARRRSTADPREPRAVD